MKQKLRYIVAYVAFTFAAGWLIYAFGLAILFALEGPDVDDVVALVLILLTACSTLGLFVVWQIEREPGPDADRRAAAFASRVASLGHWCKSLCRRRLALVCVLLALAVAVVSTVVPIGLALRSAGRFQILQAQLSLFIRAEPDGTINKPDRFDIAYARGALSEGETRQRQGLTLIIAALLSVAASAIGVLIVITQNGVANKASHPIAASRGEG
jgi:hypothetical protein